LGKILFPQKYALPHTYVPLQVLSFYLYSIYKPDI